MRKILLHSLLIIFSQIGFPQNSHQLLLPPPPPSYSWEDIKINGWSPAQNSQYETYTSETIADSIIYIGTDPNGHLLRLNSSLQQPPTDLGRVVNANFETDILALTHDGDYIFGGTSSYTGLFFKRSGETTIHFYPPPIFDWQHQQITFLKSPQIYKDNLNLYVYFACDSWDNKLKIVKWAMPLSNGNPVPDFSNISVITLDTTGTDNVQEIVSNQLALSSNSNPVLILGSSSKKIFIYNLLSNSFSKSTLSVDTKKIVASKDNHPGIFWIFDNGFCKPFTYSTEPNSVSQAGVPVSITPNNDDYVHFLFYNNFIYSYGQRINVTNPLYPDTTNYSSGGIVRGRDILLDAVHNQVIGISKWAGPGAIPYEDNINLTSLSWGHPYFTDFSPMLGEDVGGGEIVGLSIYNHKIFGGIALDPDFIYDSRASGWIYTGYPDSLYQSDELLPFNNKLYGGYYGGKDNNPKVVVSSLDDTRKCLRIISVDTMLTTLGLSNISQVRIRSLASYTYDQTHHYLFFSTSAYENITVGTSYLFKYSIESDSVNLIGRGKCAFINHLAIAPGTGSSVYIYGVDTSVFVKSNNLFSHLNDISFIDNGVNKISGGSFMYNYPNLYLMCTDTILNWHQSFIRKYSVLPTTNNMFNSNFTWGHLSGNYCDGGKLVYGNDGYIYASWSTSEVAPHASCVFKINPNNLSSFSIIEGSDILPIPDDNSIILQIDIDRGDPTNTDLYLSGYRSVLKRYTSQQLPKKQSTSLSTYQFSLSDNYPNPFNPSTNISFSIPKATHVSLKIFDILGKEVNTVVDENKSEGNYTVSFDKKGLSSGVYFYQLKTESNIAVKKMIILK